MRALKAWSLSPLRGIHCYYHPCFSSSGSSSKITRPLAESFRVGSAVVWESLGTLPFDEDPHNLLRMKDATVEFDGRVILENVNFRIRKNDVVVMLGDNGTGKTTLARLILEDIKLTSGDFWKLSDVSVGYLPQNPDELLKWNIEETTVGEYLAANTPQVSSATAAEVYANLSLPPAGASLATLSGGQRTRVVLAAHLLRVPDLLVLDEPTNNLSPPAVDWLCHVLGKWRAAVLLITHDRYLLQHPQISRVARVVELGSDGRLAEVPGVAENYVAFLQEKLRRLYLQELTYSRQMRKIKKLENELEKQHLNVKLQQAVEKATVNAHKHKFASDRSDAVGVNKFREMKGKSRRLALMLEDLVIPRFIARLDLNFDVHKAWKNRLGALVLDAQDIHVTFTDEDPPRTVLQGVSLQVRLGDRIVICGENGAGKTTLLKVLMGALKPTRGTVYRRWGRSSLAYMTQEQDQDLEQSVVQYLTGKSRYSAEDVPDLLTNVCGLPRELGTTPRLADLSTGQRRRLQFGKLVRPEHAVLVLDEPTNHLDMLGKEALERGLLKNKVTLVASSHDTYFTKVVATRIFWLANGTLREVWSQNEQLAPSLPVPENQPTCTSNTTLTTPLPPSQLEAVGSPQRDVIVPTPGIKFLVPSVSSGDGQAQRWMGPNSPYNTKEFWKVGEVPAEVRQQQSEFVTAGGIGIPDYLTEDYHGTWNTRKRTMCQARSVRRSIQTASRRLREREKIPDLRLNPASRDEARALRTLLYGTG